MGDTTKICSACLSTDRRLMPLDKIMAIIEEIPLPELKNSISNICWECWSIIKKFYKFKKRVQVAQAILKWTTEVTVIKPLSTLTVTTNLNYDYQYIYNKDPLINKQELNTFVKEEYGHQSDDNTETLDTDEILQSPVKNSDKFDTKTNIEPTQFNVNDFEATVTNNTDYKDDISTINMYTDTIEIKPNKKMIRKVNRSHISRSLKLKLREEDEEFKKKFVEVVISEEEMVKLRDLRRNHYNFKRIPYKCETCVLSFTKEENFKQHMLKKHDESIGPHQCDVCSVRFPTKYAAEKHKRKHYVYYRCCCCRYKVHEVWSALNHCRTKHLTDEPDRIHCAQCDVVVKTPDELETHIKEVHALHCNECGVKFTSSSNLRRHKARIHSVIRDFICDICSKTFKTKTRLESHMVKHNANIAKKLAYCTICKVQYKNIYVYRNHLKSSANHTEKFYSCPVCSKKFASKVYWTNHYNFYHLKKSQYKCDVCNKMFISHWKLKNHKQIYHGLSRTRDHACDLCSKKFYTLPTLRSHRLTHSEQRSYMCEDCGHTFKQRAALYTHTRLLHRQTADT
ncbi:zinc finger protein 836 [Spodoptera frugiperda]|uniref:Zinc finger protein 836 n=1 Tax=Spodoptera frugiperda TaxID=7108 RepID=A0A9R0DJX9_SPOFR|nr:zinc finger protein 836 [Spodoptera frugiperda]